MDRPTGQRLSNNATEGVSASSGKLETSPKKPGLQLTLAYRPYDIEDVITMVKEAHERSAFKDSRFSLRKSARYFSQALTNPDTYTLMIVRAGDGRALGYVYLTCGELHICEGDDFVTVETLYIPVAIRKTLLGGRVAKLLMDGIKQFKQERGAKGVFVYGTIGADDDALASYMKRSGFQQLGVNWLG